MGRHRGGPVCRARLGHGLADVVVLATFCSASWTEELQSVVDRLRLRLEILEPVRLSLVEANPLVVSVESIGTRSGPFVIRADQAFLQTLGQA